ncbi:hypothetical protein ASJ33_00905 [Dehalococcoides mccartyi]|jgi:hypothetical protein|uniref:hypothetical protein n=1 Tax=Dehalococcoides mccartyi TaxID=61435 RepID=UPI0004E07706|nr:hypothetical protein [Dehalococcoides mccartyi]AII58650.1 hypothetical protein X792_00565 [Dehalococcoides mccartyi CG1]APH11807.1 hypothetical protein ASJ33_00905 [Dehalococcoides mccartyi]
MSTVAIYARIPQEIKEKITELAQLSGKQKGDIIVDLLNQGLLLPDNQQKLREIRNKFIQQENINRNLQIELEKEKTELRVAQEKLTVAERARAHLQRILKTEIGKCDCGVPVSLYHFAYQQCPNGHSGKIKLYKEYTNTKMEIANTIVVGLALLGGVALAAELLGNKGIDNNQ